MSAPVRVVVAHGQELFRKGLVALLREQASVLVVGEAVDGEQAVFAALSAKPDVLLLDLALGRISGIEACSAVRGAAPGVKVAVLTASESEADMYAALHAGATGYLLASTSLTELVQALRAVAEGQSLISPAMAVKLLGEITTPPRGRESVEGPRLTGRELEVMRWVATGRNNREIAVELGIAANTVKNHLQAVLDKLGMRTRTEAAMYMVRQQLIDMPTR